MGCATTGRAGRVQAPHSEEAFRAAQHGELVALRVGLEQQHGGAASAYKHTACRREWQMRQQAKLAERQLQRQRERELEGRAFFG